MVRALQLFRNEIDFTNDSTELNGFMWFSAFGIVISVPAFFTEDKNTIFATDLLNLISISLGLFSLRLRETFAKDELNANEIENIALFLSFDYCPEGPVV